MMNLVRVLRKQGASKYHWQSVLRLLREFNAVEVTTFESVYTLKPVILDNNDEHILITNKVTCSQVRRSCNLVELTYDLITSKKPKN